MFTYFIFFITGAITLRIVQFLLHINPIFKVFKDTEMMTLKIIAEVYIASKTALKLSNTIIEYTDEEQKEATQKAIKLRYDTLINSMVVNLKNSLPYKVKYNTLEEAATFYIKGGKQDE